MTDSRVIEHLEVKFEIELPEDRVSKEELRLVSSNLGELVRMVLQENREE